MQNRSVKQIWQVLMPSWLSGFSIGVVSIAAVVGTIVLTNYHGSSLEQQLFEAKTTGAPVAAFNYHAITANLSQNQVISNLPLFLFWAALGVIVYLFATNLWASLSNAVELEHELNYMNAPRHALVRTAALHVIIRIVVAGIWIVYLQFFLRVVLPYALAAAHVSATSLTSLNGVTYALLAALVLFVSLQVHVVLLRLLLLKVRVFGSAT